MSKCRYDLSEDCNNTDCLTCVLDKIRAEIKEEISDHVGADNYDAVYGLQLALYIINKYKAESEDKE